MGNYILFCEKCYGLNGSRNWEMACIYDNEYIPHKLLWGKYDITKAKIFHSVSDIITWFIKNKENVVGKRYYHGDRVPLENIYIVNMETDNRILLKKILPSKSLFKTNNFYITVLVNYVKYDTETKEQIVTNDQARLFLSYNKRGDYYWAWNLDNMVKFNRYEDAEKKLNDIRNMIERGDSIYIPDENTCKVDYSTLTFGQFSFMNMFV